MGWLSRTFVASLCAALASGCANTGLDQIGAGALAATGYVDATQAQSILSAGRNVIVSQEELTAEQEYYLGRAVSAKLLSSSPPKLDPTKTKYLNEVGMTLVSVSDAPETFGGYHFAVIESSTINAMSAPGGFVYVSSGFMNLLPDEDALAAVLAHEIAHVTRKDGANAISNSALFSALSEASAQSVSIAAGQLGAPEVTILTDVLSDSVQGVTEKLLTKGFDRSQEYHADLYAAQLLQKAGYEPSALIRVLEILERETGKDTGGWFATHPAPADRIEELRDAFTFSDARLPVQARMGRYRKVFGAR
jgi:predicted Zn-dependent protease